MADGRKAYLARSYKSSSDFALPEGAFPEDYAKVDRNEGMEAEDYVVVCVLRYAPEEYERLEGTGEDEGLGKDATVCYAWRPGPVFTGLECR